MYNFTRILNQSTNIICIFPILIFSYPLVSVIVHCKFLSLYHHRVLEGILHRCMPLFPVILSSSSAQVILLHLFLPWFLIALSPSCIGGHSLLLHASLPCHFIFILASDRMIVLKWPSVTQCIHSATRQILKSSKMLRRKKKS